MSLINKKIDNFNFNIFHNNDIETSSIKKYEGKWLILFFYPADFTFICPTELEELASQYSNFKERDCEILAISRDSAFVHKAWIEQDTRLKDIKYPMASDITGEIIRYFDIFENENELSLRSTVIINPEGYIKSIETNDIFLPIELSLVSIDLINPEGYIKSIETNDNSIGRNISEVLRKLDAAIYTSKNNGEVCPVNWSKGNKSLNLPKLSIFKN